MSPVKDLEAAVLELRKRRDIAREKRSTFDKDARDCDRRLREVEEELLAAYKIASAGK